MLLSFRKNEDLTLKAPSQTVRQYLQMAFVAGATESTAKQMPGFPTTGCSLCPSVTLTCCPADSSGLSGEAISAVTFLFESLDNSDSISPDYS